MVAINALDIILRSEYEHLNNSAISEEGEGEAYQGLVFGPYIN